MQFLVIKYTGGMGLLTENGRGMGSFSQFNESYQRPNIQTNNDIEIPQLCIFPYSIPGLIDCFS